MPSCRASSSTASRRSRSACCIPTRTPLTSNGSGRSSVRRGPDLRITLSSEVCPEIREYERQSTACANAYVQPRMSGYLTRLESELRSLGLRCPLLLMTSGGGLTTLANATRFPIRLGRVGTGRRRDPRYRDRPRVRERERGLLRHGGDDGQDLPRRRIRAADDPYLRGRPCLSKSQGERPSRSDSGHRDGRDRGRRRIHRGRRRDGPAQRRPRERGSRSGARVLRPGRRETDRDRRRRSPWPHRPGRVRGGVDRTRFRPCRSGASQRRRRPARAR